MNEALITWSKQFHSKLPWRRRRTLYHTLVSEIMLQQTTVPTVLGKFPEFIRQYPSIEKLAQASEEEICMAWKGLGYYRRARNLLKAAKVIVADFGGVIPEEYSQLVRIPGIGDYTANALLAIGRDKKALAIDANIKRVLARYYGIKESDSIKLHRDLARLFEQGRVLRKINTLGPRALNEALMDLGRELCQASRVLCHECPVRQNCLARKSGRPTLFPGPSASKKAQKHELKVARLLVRKGSQLLAYQKADHEWLSGQYELPTLVQECDDPKFSQYPVKKISLRPRLELKTGITKYKIHNRVVMLGKREFDQLKLPKDQLARLEWVENCQFSVNFATVTSKILERVKKL